MPTEPIRRSRIHCVFHHLGPEHRDDVAVGVAAHGPEPLAQHRTPAVARLELGRHVGGTSVKQREALPLLQQRRIVHEPCLIQTHRRAALIDEGVLEQPKIPVAAESGDVLVVPTQHRADSLREEQVQLGGVQTRHAANLRAHMPACSDGASSSPRRRGQRVHGRHVYGGNGNRTCSDAGIVGVDGELVAALFRGKRGRC